MNTCLIFRKISKSIQLKPDFFFLRIEYRIDKFKLSSEETTFPEKKVRPLPNGLNPDSFPVHFAPPTTSTKAMAYLMEVLSVGTAKLRVEVQSSFLPGFGVICQLLEVS